MTSGVASTDMEDLTRGFVTMKLEAPGMLEEEAPNVDILVTPFSSSPRGCGGDGCGCGGGGGGGIVSS